MEKRLLAGKTVELFISPREGVPLVLLHTVHGEGRQVYEAVGRFTKMAFSFAAIDGLQWDDDMSPWPIPPVAKGEAPCTGGADAYLAKLTEMILPEILQKLPGQPAYIALSGYSLAGSSPFTPCIERICSDALPVFPAPFGTRDSCGSPKVRK